MRIAVLGGAGLMGSGVIRDLVSDRTICPIKSILVCDRLPQRIDALIDELGDRRLEGRSVDVSDAASLAASLSDVDLCINSVPTLAGHQMRIFEACLEAGTPYLDLGGLGTYTIKQKAMHEAFVARGVTAVIGAGADPGMSNVICRVVADRLDTIEKINLYWAAEVTGPENPVLVPPYSVSTVLAEYAHPSIQFLDGRHVEVPPLSGAEIIDLPEPWGRAEFMHTPHSEQLTVPLSRGIREKGIREFTWKLHLPRREHEAWVGLVKAGFGDFGEPVTIDGRPVEPLAVLNAVIERNIERHRDRMPRQESHEIHFAIGVGMVGGRRKEVRCDVVVRPNALYDAYVDAATSMNASISAQLMLLQPTRPGVWAPEEYFAIPPYVAELRKRQFDVSVTTRDLEEGDGTQPIVEQLTREPDAA
jgi:saccharopine dehydrogenase-like NADP-dependent oxidoreductase